MRIILESPTRQRVPRRASTHLVAICITIAAALTHAHAQSASDIRVEKKVLKSSDGKETEYELGAIFVPENRSEQDSRLIGVGFARFRTANKTPSPPVFLLPGGPGGSFLQGLGKMTTEQLDRRLGVVGFLKFSDVVLVDQRGASEHGEVLKSKFRFPPRKGDKPLTLEDGVAMFKAFARKSVAEHQKRDVDLRGYTVKECAHDVADLSKALAYDQIILNGTSYGSQWSFAIMRLHPEIVARALLSGVEPLNHGYDMPSHVFAAVQRMWRVVDEDDRFKPYLPPGGMAEAARTVIERLEREPYRVTTEGDDGKSKTVAVIGTIMFPWQDPATVLELYHRRAHPQKWAMIQRQMSAEREMRLIGPLIDSSLGVTPERRHLLWNDPATRYLGRRNFALFLETADIWPSEDVGDDFRTPRLCEIPVVFAQGDWDTQTPIENTYEIAPFFPNSRVLVAHRGGHGVLDNIAAEKPQAWKTILKFLRTGEMQGVPARLTLKPSKEFSPPRFPAPMPKP